MSNFLKKSSEKHQGCTIEEYMEIMENISL
jgi:hypothetical protein